MKKLAEDPKDQSFVFFFNMIDEDFDKFKRSSCQCRWVFINNKLDYNQFGSQKKDIFNSLAVLSENEIKTAIYAFKKQNQNNLLHKVILFHIDYVLYIKKKYYYAYYLSQMYYEVEKEDQSSLTAFFFLK